MKKKFSKTILLLIVVIFVMTGCSSETHTMHSDLGTVRIYDVIPQGWDHVNDSTKEYVADVKVRIQSGDEYTREKAAEELIAMEEVTFEMHPFRVGPFQAVVNEQDEVVIPYAQQIEKIEELSGVAIDYAILGSWEELDAELERNQDDGVTKIVLFDNTYTGSLIQEGKSEQYANLEKTLEDFGFYDDEKYDQMVLSAGMIDGKQVFVPLLYDVNGMIQGETKQYSWEGNVLYEPNPIEGENIDFEAFITKLNQQMKNDTGRKSVDFISTSISQEISPELFLYAAGAQWDDYRDQKDLFELMYEYYQIYMGTQIEEGGMTKQSKWGSYLSDMEDMDVMLYKEEIPVELVIDLELNQFSESVPRIAHSRAAQFFLDSCTYIVQSSESDDTSYHSMLSTLDLASYYLYRPFYVQEGTMGYWPIGIMNEADKYAAQPNNYAAVVSEGSMKQAVKVIEAMLELEVDFKYGFSIRKDIRDKQLEVWKESYGECYGRIGSRSVINNLSSSAANKSSDAAEKDAWSFEEMLGHLYWQDELVLPIGNQYVNIDWKEDYLNQVRHQLDNIGIAQIPDGEVLSIWQETLEECIDSELSAEAGFELLCERMDAFYSEGGNES